MAVRNARDLYTRRGEGVSIWVVPASEHHDQRSGCQGRLLRVARRQELPARRRTTRSQRECRTCDRAGTRHTSTSTTVTLGSRNSPSASTGRARPPVAEYALWLGDDALDPRAAARRVDRPCARARGGCRARQHRARPARPRPHRCCTTRARHPTGARTTSRTSATNRSSAARGSSSSRTATSPTRSRASCIMASTCSSCTPRLSRLHRPDARRRSRRRRSRRSTTTATTPSSGSLRLARRHRRVAAPDAPRARRPVAVRRRAVPRRAAPRPLSTASPCGRRRCAPPSTRSSPPCSPRPSSRSRLPAPASGGGRRGQHTRAPGLPARRDAGARPSSSGGIVVTPTAVDAPPRPRRRPGRRRPRRRRPRGPGAHASRTSACSATVEVDGDRVDGRRSPRPTRGCPAIDAMRDDVALALTAAGYERGDGRARALPGLDDRLDDRGRQGEAPPVRHRRHRPAARPSGAGPIRLELSVKCPRCGSLRHPRARPLRLDVLQGAVRVPRLPRAVRLLQGALMAARDLGATKRRARAHSTRSRSPTCARSPPTASR